MFEDRGPASLVRRLQHVTARVIGRCGDRMVAGNSDGTVTRCAETGRMIAFHYLAQLKPRVPTPVRPARLRQQHKALEAHLGRRRSCGGATLNAAVGLESG